MANNNPYGTAKYWFNGSVAQVIDIGVASPAVPPDNLTTNWIGTTDYWYNGTSSGYLQGSFGDVGESAANLTLKSYYGGKNTLTRAYGIIIY